MPNENKCPPDFDDFPIVVQQALEVFNKLGDRVYPDIGYVGKEYTSLPIHMQIHKIDNVELFMETLVRLDAIAIKKSADQLKKARDNATRKSKNNGK